MNLRERCTACYEQCTPYLQKTGLALLFLLIVIAFVVAIVTLVRAYVEPRPMDRYLPAATTVGYVEVDMKGDDQLRSRFLQDMEQGVWGHVGKELWSGSGTTLLNELVGNRMGMAWVQEEQLTPVYFLSITDKDELLNYWQSKGSVLPWEKNPSIFLMGEGGSFAYMWKDRYVVVSQDPAVLHAIAVVERQDSLEQDMGYNHGRGHLGRASTVRGYVSTALWMDWIGKQDAWQAEWRDMRLLAQPILKSLKGVHINMHSEERGGWTGTTIVHGEKELMMALVHEERVPYITPLWGDGRVTFGMDFGNPAVIGQRWTSYVEQSADPLAYILRAYVAELGRPVWQSLDTTQWITGGTLLVNIDMVTLQPSWLLVLDTEGDNEWWKTWQEKRMEGLVGVLVQWFPEAQVTTRMTTQGERQVTSYEVGDLYSIHGAVEDTRLLLMGGSMEQWWPYLDGQASTTAVYPAVRSLSYTMDPGLWLPVSGTGSLVGNLGQITGGLRSFDDGVRMDWSIAPRR